MSTRPVITELLMMKRFVENVLQRTGLSRTVPGGTARWDMGYRFAPPGHYYSPIPNYDEIEARESQIWGAVPPRLAGIQLNVDEQLALFERLTEYYDELPFKPGKCDNMRYHFDNPSYSYSDGIILYAMLRELKPNRVIEVGSGYSSCVMMDTNELFLNNSVQVSFIEPYPQLLHSLMKAEDVNEYQIIPEALQDVDPKIFSQLQSNDILFIDSTHVSKINSDVNMIFFEILPRLTEGVYVHFHDIFYPFEYPKDWVYEGRCWTESYLLRAFLEFNNAFEIAFFTTFLEHFFEDRFRERMPLCLLNRGGSIWIRRTTEAVL